MNHKIADSSKQQALASLFTSVFSASEGEKEGQLIGNLACELSSKIDNKEIICFVSYQQETITGAIFFTRLHLTQAIRVYLLAPVAVSTRHQRKGIGQALINYGIGELKKRSVGIVVTYGDPSYYCKTGFQPLSEKLIQAPLQLSMPAGWLGQSLTEAPIPVINERPSCVQDFNNPAYW